jgi:hypothetical protein
VRQLSQPTVTNGKDNAIGEVEHPECLGLAGQDKAKDDKTGTDGHQPAQAKPIAEHTDPNGDGPLGEVCQREHAGDSSAAPAKFLENRNEKYAESIVYTPHDSKDQG